MEQVKNANDKLVCQIDKAQKMVEIVNKGYKTIIRFTADGQVVIVNVKPAA
jgi:hypothetical protein